MNIKKSYLLYILYVICSINISLNAKLEFSNKDALFNLKTDNAKLKISSTNDIHSWQVQQISSTPSNDTIFLYDNMIWGNDSGNFRVPDQGFEFVGDLTIPDATVINITQDRIIDGQGHSLILGNNAQISLDNSVTLTLRNLNIKNTFNSEAFPPIRCANALSQVVFENVKFALNDDFYFKNGQMYIHDDVIFTGTSKFIYNSGAISHIQPHSTLRFSEATTFEYSPNSHRNDLINLVDKSSSIHLDGSTLLVTDTGIRLTRGQLLIDNKVTFSYGGGNNITSLQQLVTKNFSTGGRIVKWSPNGNYLAVSANNSTEDLLVYSWNGSTLTKLDSKDIGSIAWTVDWSPNGNYLAVGGNNSSNDVIIYSWNGSTLTQLDTKDHGSYAKSVAWNPDGNYLAVGGNNGSNDVIIYSWNGSTLTQLDTKDHGTEAWSVAWSPSGSYLAVGGNYGLTDVIIYSWNGSTLTSVTTKDFGNSVFSVDWSPNGNYLAAGGNNTTTDVIVYSFVNSTTLTQLDSKDFGNDAISVSWNQNGNYLTVSGNNGTNDITIYSWNGSTLTQATTKTFGDYAWSAAWHPNYDYLAVGGNSGSTTDLVVYSYSYTPYIVPQAISSSILLGNSSKGETYNMDISVLGGAQGIIDSYVWYDSTSSSSKGKLDFASIGASLVLSDTGALFKISNTNNISGWKEESIVLASGNDNSWMPSGGITYGSFGPGTPPPARLLYHNSNAIVNISDDVTENSSAIVSLEKFVIENSNAIVNTSEALLNSKITENSWALLALREDVTENSNAIINSEGELAIQNSNAIVDHTQHFVSLNDGKLYAVGKISGETFINGRAILSSPIDLNGATLTNGGDILFSSQTTVSSSGYLNPQGNAYVLGGDLIIPDAVILTFTSDGIIDGQGHSLTFGTTAQILIDTAVTLTLRNLTIKNNLSPISIPPIKCLDWDSKLVLDNVKFALNDDFAFKTGQMYINDDVIFTGTSKFIYQSVLPSYVQPHSTLYFDEQTTLDYSPNSTLKGLIVLSDETSSIYLNGATLQTTHTGIQLTKGRLLLENKVTLSSAANNLIYNLTFTGIPVNFRDKITNGDLDPSNRYFAVGNWGGTPDLEIYYFDGNVLTGTPIEQKEIGFSVNNVNWSPNGKNLSVALSTPWSGDELQIYSFENGSLSTSPVDSKSYGATLNSSNWHPSGKYIALGGHTPDSGAQLQIYSFDNDILSTNPIYSEVPFKYVSPVKWHPSGKFLAIAGSDSSSNGQLKIYSFYDNTLSGTPIESRGYGTTNAGVTSIDWSPDGNYLVLCGTSDGNAQTQIYSFYDNQLSASPLSEYHSGALTEFFSVKWSPNGKYISVTGRFIDGSGNELIVFKIDNGIIPSIAVTGTNFGFKGLGSAWTADEKYLFVFGQAPDSGYELQQYRINYMFDTTQQTVSNAIIFGDSAKGSNYDLNTFVLGGARVEINGLAWFDDSN